MFYATLKLHHFIFEVFFLQIDKLHYILEIKRIKQIKNSNNFQKHKNLF